MKSMLTDKFRFYFLCLLLLAGLIITYSNHFNNSFHFDDDHAIVNNPWVKNVKNIPRFFTDATTSSSLPQNQGYRPGGTTLCAIDYWIAKHNPLGLPKNESISDDGLNPFYYHLSIFFYFILQGILMFLLFKKILDISINHRWNKYFALFMVALYCFHAAIAETVNYISARSDGFSTLMVLLSMVIYIYYPNKRKYGLYLIPYILGFFVKEPALMEGPLLFFYILLFEKKADLTKLFRKETFNKILLSLKAVAIMLLIGVLLYIMYLYFRPKTWLPSIISPWDYLITQPFVFVQYFKTFLLPTELSADSDWTTLSTIFDIRLLMGLMFIGGMIWLSIRLSRQERFRPITFGILWFFIAPLPSSSIIPLSEMLNDHRVYFPYIGLSLALVTALIYVIILRDEKKFLSSIWMKSLTLVLVAGLLIGHAYGAHQRNKVWENEETLWYDVVHKSPLNGRGLMNYGLSQMRKGNYPVAKEYFEKALVLSPYYSLLHINLAILYGATGDNINAEKYYKSAITFPQYLDQSYYFYGSFLYGQKRYEEAKVYLKNSIANNPNYIEPRMLLMELYSVTEDWGTLSKLAEETLKILPNDARCLAYINAAKNKTTKLDVAKELVAKTPTSDNYINLSLQYYEEGMYEECISACKEAIKLKPDNATAYNNMCSAYNALKQFDKAVEACNNALKISPDYELAKGNLNWAKSQGGK